MNFWRRHVVEREKPLQLQVVEVGDKPFDKRAAILHVPYVFGMLLHLDSMTDDGVGYRAEFIGKPSTHGNRFSVPMGEEEAKQMTVGHEYLFVLAEDRG